MIKYATNIVLFIIAVISTVVIEHFTSKYIIPMFTSVFISELVLLAVRFITVSLCLYFLINHYLKEYKKIHQDQLEATKREMQERFDNQIKILHQNTLDLKQEIEKKVKFK